MLDRQADDYGIRKSQSYLARSRNLPSAVVYGLSRKYCGGLFYISEAFMAFIQLIGGAEVDILIRDHPNAFLLLSIIALRASRKTGVALIGDYQNYGMTRQQYRTALNVLNANHQTTTQPTNRGTAVRLISNTIYNINAMGKQPPESQTANHQTTTNNKLISNKKENTLSDPEQKAVPFTDEFDICYLLYPRKERRRGALKAFIARRRQGASFEDLKTATMNYAKHCRNNGKEKTYILMAQTFYGPKRPYEDWIAGDPTTGTAERIPQPGDYDYVRQA